MIEEKRLSKIFYVFLLFAIVDFIWVVYYCSWSTSKQTGFPKNSFVFFKCVFLFLIGGCWWHYSEIRDIRVLMYLIMATCGDFFLEFNGWLCFISGGICFASSHIFAILSFNVVWKEAKKAFFLLAIPGFVLYFVILLPSVLKSDIITYVIIIYMILIFFAYMTTIARSSKTPIKSLSFWACYIGYSSYLFSDFLIFCSKTGLKLFNTVGYEIMLTYYVAHSLIVYGLCSEKCEEENSTPFL